MSTAREIAATVRARRIDRKLSQEQLARLIGCSVASIHSLEAGPRKQPQARRKST